MQLSESKFPEFRSSWFPIPIVRDIDTNSILHSVSILYAKFSTVHCTVMFSYLNKLTIQKQFDTTPREHGLKVWKSGNFHPTKCNNRIGRRIYIWHTILNCQTILFAAWREHFGILDESVEVGDTHGVKSCWILYIRHTIRYLDNRGRRLLIL